MVKDTVTTTAEVYDARPQQFDFSDEDFTKEDYDSIKAKELSALHEELQSFPLLWRNPTAEVSVLADEDSRAVASGRGEEEPGAVSGNDGSANVLEAAPIPLVSGRARINISRYVTTTDSEGVSAEDAGQAVESTQEAPRYIQSVTGESDKRASTGGRRRRRRRPIPIERSCRTGCRFHEEVCVRERIEAVKRITRLETTMRIVQSIINNL
ncbi:uncharacterized protein LOC144023823 isoform X2 [Festucalex cinctus]